MFEDRTLLDRTTFIKRIKQNFKIHAVTGLIGPRQVGKTTLAKQIAKDFQGPVHYFDFEDPVTLSQFHDSPLILDDLEGLIVLDEIQRQPELFPYMRVLVDRYPKRKYLVLGSASRDMLNQSSESLAGRIGYVELTPFQLSECNDWKRLWHNGGFPSSLLAKTIEDSQLWRKSFIHTFIERDIKYFDPKATPQTINKLWHMLAHYHGNTSNYSELARSLDISQAKIKHYIDILEGAFMIRCLHPWHEALDKRQLKSPKVYIRDSGILHTLLDINTEKIGTHPKVGASWEGFALETIIYHYKKDQEDCYFWGTHQKAELDLFFPFGKKRIGFEIKYSSSPSTTKSMRIAIEDLKLDELIIIIPGDKSWPIDNTIRVQGLNTLKSIH